MDNQNQQQSLESVVINKLSNKVGVLEGNLTIVQSQYEMLAKEYQELEKKYNDLYNSQAPTEDITSVAE